MTTTPAATVGMIIRDIRSNTKLVPILLGHIINSLSLLLASLSSLEEPLPARSLR